MNQAVRSLDTSPSLTDELEYRYRAILLDEGPWKYRIVPMGELVESQREYENHINAVLDSIRLRPVKKEEE